MHDLAVRGGMVVTPYAAFSADIGVDGETIVEVSEHVTGRHELDATGKLVLPGVIDAHTHMALPVSGTMSNDDFRTGSIAAAFGGVTTLIDFTVGAPEHSIPEAIDRRKAELSESVIDVALHGEVVGWHAGREAEFREACELGVTSFKFYTAYGASGRRSTPPTMKAAFSALAQLDALALVHCEDEGLIDSIVGRFPRERFAEMSALPEARPAACEQSSVSQVGRIARQAGCRVHIVHLSSALGLEALRAWVSWGAQLTAETCPQYLVLTKTAYDGDEGHLFSAAPALRTEADNEALWTGLRSRDIAFVATDHCAFTREQKTWRGSFLDLPYGLPGVETLLPLLYSEGVAGGRLALTDIPRLLSQGPAQRYGLYPTKGAVEVGSDADLVVFDPDSDWTIAATGLHMHTDFSPYEGRQLRGRVAATVSRGDVIVKAEEIQAQPGRGRFVPCGVPGEVT